MEPAVRVALVTHTMAGRGGIERVVEQHSAGLRARGHQVDVIAGPTLGSGWLARAGSAALLGLDSGARLRGYDVVLAHYQPAPLVASRSGRPYVVFLHHPLRAAHPTAVQREQLRYRLWNRAGVRLAGADHRSVSGAAAVAVPSPSVRAEAAAVYRLTPTLLPLGVDTDLFQPGPSRRGPLLFVGRPEERYKRLDWALEVARRLARPLHVVGQARPRDVPGVDVTWRGYLTGPALAQAYRTSDLLLFPSMREDFGLVPLEAMACGLPVVAWDDGHGPSSTLRPGSGGLLAPAYDLDAFTSLVKTILDDEPARRRLSACGSAWVREQYSIERHLDGLEQLLSQAAGASR
jgi:glycosyltransferase involved in cell wall biosynthesis